MASNDCKFDERKVLGKDLLKIPLKWTDSETFIPFSDHYIEYFGDPKSPYQIAVSKRDPRTIHTGTPIEGPWIQGTLLKMLKRVENNIYPPGPMDTDEHDGLEVSK